MALRCDVVAVGTELLLGQITDTNSAYIGEQLALSGIDSLRQVKVGDNLARIVDELRLALSRADAVIVCGGLGPTHDDITREAIAEVMGAELVLDDEVADRIREMFASRGRRMPENNLRQAMVPTGATVIPQTRGTAPGLICPVGDKVVYATPGVPHELYEMLERAVLPDLRRRSGEAAVIASRVVRTWGESESGLNERLAPLIERLDRSGTPTLAFLASGWEGLKIRLTAKAPTAAEAGALLAGAESEIRAELGTLVFGADDDTMESVVLQLLRERQLSLGLAESVTGGLVAARLTAVPGASDVLRGSVVSYATEVKASVLGVPPRTCGVGRCCGGDGRGGTAGARGRRRAGPHRGGRPDRAGGSACGHAPRRPGARRGRRDRVAAAARPARADAAVLGHQQPRPPPAAAAGAVSLARLFVAVWPPPEVLDVVAALPRVERPGVRWTTRDQWHVTLRFLGQADPAEAVEAVRRIEGACCEAALGPRPGRLGRSALVLPVTGLADLAAEAERATEAIGKPPTGREFRGHLTLARLKDQSVRAPTDLVVGARWTVAGVTLVESRLHPNGARYEVLEEVALRPAVPFEP